ncbi:MAG: hypothetical protein A2W01_07045 [Candidatus Solincola sediminis]|uniref:Uncharacterized protein n=1 Tax=Candidatus Solincola sediminis TaxID=1797199 RepID=A0A1F2WMX9_9ACTN|nr:MAG: hypothetical protein A2W01_07045 [Candidatus Solincola sediminis]OFW58197.1 MAG: hypothetical protein A2Y75_08540 [Candidatus Solincola sediminis]
MAEYVHQQIGEEIRSMAGYYMVLEERVLEYKGRTVLHLIEAAAADTSCCGGAGLGFIMVPGYINALRTCQNEEGLWLSDVDPIKDEEERREITALIKAGNPGFQQVNFT